MNINFESVCRRLTPILLVGCLVLAALAATVTLLSLRRGESYLAERRPVEERRRAVQTEIDQLQPQADASAETASAADAPAAPIAPTAENAQLARQIEGLRQKRYALYDQRRAIMARERQDWLLRFHAVARLPLINLQILCLACLVASRLLETALAAAPQRSSPARPGGRPLKPSSSTLL